MTRSNPPRGVASLGLVSACLVVATGMAPAQSPDQALERVRALERERVAVMARVAPAVCSVMPLDAPGGGSGVVFDPLGFIATNFHCVGKPDVKRMKIGLPDGELYGATVLGVDPGSDLAVLLLDPRADGKPWPSATLGDSDALLVGEQVFAMGNPFLLASDFSPTTTFGVVSATHRYQPGQGNRALVYPDCIQVDVPINPGNSGGPLFNLRGEVVGINGRISIQDQRGRVNVGVGFAIASNQIRNFLPDLMAGRFAEHGTLDLHAWFMERDGRQGVFVQSVFADSRVMAFGLQLGDEITRFNGIPVRSANQLATLVGVLPAETWVELGFRPLAADDRLGDERSVRFRLQRLDTGSSREEDRLASEDHRKLALAALARPLEGATLQDAVEGATLELSGPEGVVVRLSRRGEQLRIDNGPLTLVLRDDGSAFARDGELLREPSAEERAKLERIRRCNPLLRPAAGRRALCAEGLLAGGTMVGNRPAYRVRLPGDGELEVWLFLDGSAAGCRYRDPVQKALVELRRDGARSSVVLDGELAAGWSIAATDESAPPSELFERPQS
ncbi:MAG: trypsin-like peptidase domain-containing protein [Planctomycetes bacterium]|nr:trypsin-like peptidase domain-containing protein [Planctomycetota bacterium]